jgi:hypothetical protein
VLDGTLRSPMARVYTIEVSLEVHGIMLLRNNRFVLRKVARKSSDSANDTVRKLVMWPSSAWIQTAYE